jgi:hypothetical protein
LRAKNSYSTGVHDHARPAASRSHRRGVFARHGFTVTVRPKKYDFDAILSPPRDGPESIFEIV